jgi:putative DNA primase/helicase
MSAINAIEGFRDAMHRAGLVPPDVIEADGLLHRYQVEGDKRGSLNGWYCLHLDGRAAGIFGSWKTGQRETWAADGKRMNDTEREAFAALIQAAKAKAQAERRTEHEARATEARADWVAAVPADPAFPYLLTKGVKVHGLRQLGGVFWFPCSTSTGCCGTCNESRRTAPSGSSLAGLAGCTHPLAT